MKLIGPFRQIVTMNNLPLKGAISDDRLEIVPEGGILVHGSSIFEVENYSFLEEKYADLITNQEIITSGLVAFPGFVEAHTHICWAGSRIDDYSKRLSGKSYLEIARDGGGIWKTVQHTRVAEQEHLELLTAERANSLLKQGITTIEVKSGYGLDAENELKILKAIKSVQTKADLIPTCLAAHVKPNDFSGSNLDYLKKMIDELLPIVLKEKLSTRVDVFVDETAFYIDEARSYLMKAREMGFDLIVHGDQFHKGGSQLAVELGAVSVDHLEAADEATIRMLAESNVTAVVLPGASMGLGTHFAPARGLIDAGACVAISSDWNPGSAPMGNLLVQAAVMGASEKLTIAETLAGITFRAAAALKLADRAVLKPGMLADIVAFQVGDYREILYRQGNVQPSKVWKNGQII